MEKLEKSLVTLAQYFPNIPLVTAREILEGVIYILKNAEGVVWPDYLESGFSRPNLSIAGLQRILSCLPQGTTELMCHPGYVGMPVNAIYRIERENEIEILSNVDINESIIEQDINLIAFDQLP